MTQTKIKRVHLLANGDVTVYDEEGELVPEFTDGTWQGLRDAVLARADDNTEFYVISPGEHPKRISRTEFHVTANTKH